MNRNERSQPHGRTAKCRLYSERRVGGAVCSNLHEMFRRRAARLLAGAAGAASAAGACAAGGVLVASSETRLEPSAEPEPDMRPIEILVHNISHSDMLVMLGEDGDENGRTFLARPVFNKFQPVTEAILQQIAALKVRPTRVTERGGPRLTPHCTAPCCTAPQNIVARHATYGALTLTLTSGRAPGSSRRSSTRRASTRCPLGANPHPHPQPHL